VVVAELLLDGCTRLPDEILFSQELLRKRKKVGGQQQPRRTQEE
jgi:hypothetical protein